MTTGMGVEVGISETDDVGDDVKIGAGVKVGLGEGDSEGTEGFGAALTFGSRKNGSKFTVKTSKPSLLS